MNKNLGSVLYRCILILLVLSLLAGSSQNTVFGNGSNSVGLNPTQETLPITPDRLNHLIEDYIKENMDENIPGFAISVVYNDTILVNQAHGYADIGSNTTMDVNTPIRVGSLSKPVLATATIKAKQDGLLSLDDPITDYLGSISNPKLEVPDTSIGDLLLHRGGFNDILLNVHTRDIDDYQPIHHYLESVSISPAFEAGKVMSYSSFDYTLVGYALQTASGLMWEDYIDQVIFDPLNMSSTTYLQPQPEDIMNRLAQGYDTEGETIEPIPHDYTVLGPGVSLVSSSSDMASFLKMLLKNGQKANSSILDSNSANLLLNQIHRDATYLRGATYGFTEYYYENHTTLYHEGNGIGSAARLALVPDQNFGVFTTANARALATDGGPGKGTEFIRGLQEKLIESFIKSNRVEHDVLDPITSNLQNYEGLYVKASTYQRSDLLRIEGLLDQLEVSDNGDGTLKIGSNDFQEVEDGVFQHIVFTDWFYAFIKDDSGTVKFLSGGGTGSYVKSDPLSDDAISYGMVGMIIILGLILVLVSLRSSSFFDKMTKLIIGLMIIQLITLVVTLLQMDVLTIFYSIPLSVLLVMYLTVPLLVGQVILIGYQISKVKEKATNVDRRYAADVLLRFFLLAIYIAFISTWHILP